MKLTPFGKLFLVLVILSVAGFIVYNRFGNQVRQWASNEPTSSNSGTTGALTGSVSTEKRDVSKEDFAGLDSSAGKNTPKTVAVASNVTVGPGKLDRPLVVGINTWAGHAPGIVANGGFEPNSESLYFKKHGIQVKFVLIEDPAAKLAAFIKGDIDIMWDTVDSWAREASVLAEQKLSGQSILQEDWSRGGDGIVALKTIKSIEDLKGKRIATTEFTPSHWLLLYLLSQSGLSTQEKLDIEKNLVKVAEAPLAAAAFKAGKVDAAVTWEPDLTASVDARPDEAHILISTSAATHIIADTLVARQDLVDHSPQTIQAFVKGWFEGIEMMKADPQGTNGLVAKVLKLTPDDVSGMLSGLKLTHFSDNALFYGLSGGKSYYDTLFNSAFIIWRKKGAATKNVDAKDFAATSFVASLSTDYPHEKVQEAFQFDKAPKAHDRAIVNKQLSIHFLTNSDQMMEGSEFTMNALGETMMGFGNTFLKIEGNTDSRGSTEANVALSQKRAEAVKKYLIANFQIPEARIVTTGNGPKNPVADNKTEDGRAMNRRTDIHVVLNAQ